MPTIELSRLLPDGSLEVVLVEQRIVVVAAKDVRPATGKGMVRPQAELLAAIREAVKVR